MYAPIVFDGHRAVRSAAVLRRAADVEFRGAGPAAATMLLWARGRRCCLILIQELMSRFFVIWTPAFASIL